MRIISKVFFLISCLVKVSSCNSQIAETNNVVLINVDTLDRKGIAEEIEVVNFLNPKVIAIDLQFSSHMNYEYDGFLIDVLDECKNLIMASVIENYTGKAVEYVRFTFGSLPIFLTNARTGFVNTMLCDNKSLTLKDFSTHEKVNRNIEYHFGVRTAMAFDSLKAIQFVKSNPRVVNVDYKEGKRKFKVFSSSEVLNNKISREDIDGKIVMIGFLGPGDEDKFFAPINKKIETSEPNMYGLEYLANIVVQVLEQ